MRGIIHTVNISVTWFVHSRGAEKWRGTAAIGIITSYNLYRLLSWGPKTHPTSIKITEQEGQCFEMVTCVIASQMGKDTRSTSLSNLDPKSPAVSSSSGPLILPPLGSDIRLCVAVRHAGSFTKVSHSFPGILRASQENLKKTEYARSKNKRTQLLESTFADTTESSFARIFIHEHAIRNNRAIRNIKMNYGTV